MYVTVSLKIELATTASFSEMEIQIQEAGREAMKEVLKQALRQNEEQHKLCPACGSKQTRTQGTHPVFRDPTRLDGQLLAVTS